MQQCEIHSFSS